MTGNGFAATLYAHWLTGFQIVKQLDWAALQQAAKDAAAQAYAPYSQFPVGVAVLAENGQIFTGCNVENASYGGTVCAERNAIAAAVVAGQRRFQALMVYTPQTKLTPPCGICRQVIAEFFLPDSPIASCNHLGQQQSWSLQQLLPDAFTPTYLAASTKIEKDV
ncbi:cytidine deaminase [Alishewanella agri BL06]|uniref:Cytidine deaminase n=1 Tax=Alishewanella agri BL06 TaxID=1195246 RepID=I8U4Q0_9ALTE|nr:cytidine deaminase [Alishewanella agri BL06]